MNIAWEVAHASIHQINERIDADDKMGVLEIVEEWTPNEKKMIWSQLKPEVQQHLKELMK